MIDVSPFHQVLNLTFCDRHQDVHDGWTSRNNGRPSNHYPPLCCLTWMFKWEAVFIQHDRAFLQQQQLGQTLQSSEPPSTLCLYPIGPNYCTSFSPVNTHDRAGNILSSFASGVTSSRRPFHGTNQGKTLFSQVFIKIRGLAKWKNNDEN